MVSGALHYCTRKRPIIGENPLVSISLHLQARQLTLSRGMYWPRSALELEASV